MEWARYAEVDFGASIRTRISRDQVSQLATSITHVPSHVQLHPRVERIMGDRRRMAAGDLPMDWGFA